MNFIDEETVKLAAITTVLPVITVPSLEFPRLYIVAPGLRGAIKYPLELAPSWAFDAWVQRAAEGGIAFDYAQAAKLLRINRERWTIEEKWCMLNALAEAGIALPLYSRVEAERAMMTMEGRDEQR